jgi:transcription initiation factor IIE alpha subunit
MGLFKSEYSKLKETEQKAIARIAYAMIYADTLVSSKELNRAETFGIKKNHLKAYKDEDLDKSIEIIAQADEKTRKKCKKVIDKIMSADGYHATAEDKLSMRLNEAWKLG